MAGKTGFSLNASATESRKGQQQLSRELENMTEQENTALLLLLLLLQTILLI